MNMNMKICIYICIYICISMYIHIHVCIYIYTCVYIYTYMYIYIHTCIYIYICISIFIYIHIRFCINIYIHLHLQQNQFSTHELVSNSRPLSTPETNGLVGVVDVRHLQVQPCRRKLLDAHCRQLTVGNSYVLYGDEMDVNWILDMDIGYKLDVT